MKTTILTLAFLIAGQGFANEHSLAAHEHGAIKMSMAVEKNRAEIDIDGPAESFLGFEYAPKTAKEKKVLRDLEAKRTKNLETFIAFDKKLNCKVSEASFKQVVEEKEHHESEKKNMKDKEQGLHSDIEAKAKITCSSDLVGSEVTISLKKIFKNIKKLSVEMIATETKSVEITKPIQKFKI